MATLALNPSDYPAEVGPRNDPVAFDGPHQGLDFPPRRRSWADMSSEYIDLLGADTDDDLGPKFDVAPKFDIAPKFDGGLKVDSSSKFEAQPIGSYWQEEWRQDHGDYGYGQGGVMDWAHMQSGWQMPMAWPDRWQNRTRNANPNKPKRRFCTSFPDVSQCRRGATCAFAHSREEIGVPLLSVAEEKQDPSALTDDFFMYKYKTSWCPIGVQHEWHTCVYAHNYQDARRPITIGYGARLCPYWSKKDTTAEYSQRCPLGLRCPYSHGAKEQLYHPHYFKTVVCRDLRGKACPRHKLCAFYHHRHERRATPVDDVDYANPLPSEALPDDWVADFLSPPFHAESGKPKMDDGKDWTMMGQMEHGGMEHGGQYGQMWAMGQQQTSPDHHSQQQQQPVMVVLCMVPPDGCDPSSVQCGMPYYPVPSLPGQTPSAFGDLSPGASPRGGHCKLDSPTDQSSSMFSNGMLPWASAASEGTSRLTS
mmetsp:Transcript_73601/g.172393  ORF Transcript_73601/g.172393 Transcript_73601/m.172393 type:complete len:478 (+) Transcript_73601:44-1477(+)